MPPFQGEYIYNNCPRAIALGWYVNAPLGRRINSIRAGCISRMRRLRWLFGIATTPPPKTLKGPHRLWGDTRFIEIDVAPEDQWRNEGNSSGLALVTNAL